MFYRTFLIFILGAHIVLSQSQIDTIITKAIEYQQQGEYKNALITFNKAYRINPNEPELNGNIGLTYLLLDSLDLAEKYLETEIKMYPVSELAHYSLACVNFRQNNISIGIKHLELSFVHGYRDYDWLFIDKDLTLIQADKRFLKLLDKYFSKKDIKSIKYYLEADSLFERRDYSKAAKLFEKSAKVEEQTAHLSIWWVATNYNLAAISYYKVGKYRSCIKMFNKAIKYFLNLDEKESVASAYDLMGWAYYELKEYSRTIESKENSLDIYLELDHAQQIANLCHSIGSSYGDLNNVKKELEYRLIALKKYDELQDFEECAFEAELILGCYRELGDLNAAIHYGEKSLEYYGQQNSYPEIVGVLLTLSELYISTYKFDIGFSYAEQALSISNKFDLGYESILATSIIGFHFLMINKPDIAVTIYEKVNKELTSLSDTDSSYNIEDYYYDVTVLQLVLGIAYTQLGDHAGATQCFKRGLATAEQFRFNDFLINYCRGYFYSTQNKFKEAMKCYKEALKDSETLSTWEWLAPIVYNEIGAIYYLSKDYKNSLRNIKKSISISSSNNNYAAQLESLIILAIQSIMQDDTNEAIKWLKYCILIIEEQLPILPDTYKREQYENLLIYYEFLAMSLINVDSTFQAIECLEYSKYKTLKKQLGVTDNKYHEEEFDFTNIDLDEDKIIISYDLINESYHSIYRTSKSLYGENNPFFAAMDFQDKESNYDILFSTVIYNENGNLKYDYTIGLKDSAFFDDKIPDLRTMVKLYRYYIKYDKIKADELSRRLYNYLIEPYKPYLDKYKKIIIMPDPHLAKLPFETLKDKDGSALVNNCEIQYVQSYSIYNILQNRDFQHDRIPLLAFGGANYENNLQKDSIDIKTDSNSNIKESIYGSIASRGSLRYAYTALGFSNWNNLPGSLNEIMQISKIINNTKVIKGDEVTENKIKTLSANKELSRYQMLHFAMHGVVIPEYPEMSALVFSQADQDTNNEDGYLRVSEIADLKINADFVNLSACETDLGKVYSSEGVINLTQAFMIAGANSVLATLWQIDDVATSVFMTSFYQKIADGVPYSLAITDTKREFISGYHGEDYKAPYYWAPFVYYGK